MVQLYAHEREMLNDRIF